MTLPRRNSPMPKAQKTPGATSSKGSVAVPFEEEVSSRTGKSESEVEEEDEVVRTNNDTEAWKSHHFLKSGRTSCTGKFMKRVHYEWELLQQLPKGEMAVCVCEERADLMIAAIKGPQDTPYADGLFFFDILLPAKYPDEPPKVHFHAHGDRVNPNLYQCGKVCLSLLGTWPGQHSIESWDPKNSSVFQVLLSIQGLILVREPWYNEPGFEQMRGIKAYEEESTRYTNLVFLLTLKSIIRSMENPPPQFASLCTEHFKSCRDRILERCLANRASASSKGKAHKSSQVTVWSGGIGLAPPDLVKSLDQTIPRLQIALGLTAAKCEKSNQEDAAASRRKRKLDDGEQPSSSISFSSSKKVTPKAPLVASHPSKVSKVKPSTVATIKKSIAATAPKAGKRRGADSTKPSAKAKAK